MDFSLNEVLEDLGIDRVLKIDGFDNSIIGVSEDDRLIYDFDLMVKEYCEQYDCDEIDAIEWIEYNTIRSLPYLGTEHPIIMKSKIRDIQYND